MLKLKKKVNQFPTPYTCMRAIKEGGIETKLSMILMGFGNFVHKQKIKGLLYLTLEVAYIVFMAVNGIHFLSTLGSLGSAPQKEVWDATKQVYLYTKGDQSVLLLLYGVATVLVTLLMIWAWRGALKSAFKAECLDKEGRHVNSFVEDLKSLLHENLHRLLMTPPMVFIFTLTILPLVFMICMAFTNYSKLGNHLMLFDWVGLDNFKALFDTNSILGSTFWSVLGWTLVWAFFATFSNLIVTFTGNVNNFNVIYLLSGGDPVTDLASTAGKTDLLVTWLYKLTIDKQYYNIGAVIGILTFIILAVGALLTYRNSKSYKEGEI